MPEKFVADGMADIERTLSLLSQRIAKELGITDEKYFPLPPTTPHTYKENTLMLFWVDVVNKSQSIMEEFEKLTHLFESEVLEIINEILRGFRE